jgi:pimeloyl-ACP methyl ester carboxylesterase
VSTYVHPAADELPQGDVGLLQTRTAQDLLASTELARVAYVAKDGSPRVFPMLFHWTGDELVLCTFAGARKINAIRARPDIAVTIDAATTPPRVLLLRGKQRSTRSTGSSRSTGWHTFAMPAPSKERPTWRRWTTPACGWRASGCVPAGSASSTSSHACPAACLPTSSTSGAPDVAEFVLLPGAGGDPWYWHLVVAELRGRGHTAIAVDLPGEREGAGLPEYVDITVRAAHGLQEVVLVAQSLGVFTAAMAAPRLPVQALAFVNAMIPLPGETPGGWWANTGHAEAQTAARGDHDPADDFTHDVPAALISAVLARHRDQSATVLGSPCEFDAWPQVPIHSNASSAVHDSAWSL